MKRTRRIEWVHRTITEVRPSTTEPGAFSYVLDDGQSAGIDALDDGEPTPRVGDRFDTCYAVSDDGHMTVTGFIIGMLVIGDVRKPYKQKLDG